MPHPKGGYFVNGVRVPGVTTIIGRFKESGGLLHWAFEQGKAAERGEISHLYDKRDEAAEAGTLAHELVEAYIHNGETDISYSLYSMVDEEIFNMARQGFENFLRWQEDSRIEIIAQEAELTSQEYFYGGCPDAIGRDSRGQLCLLDWKTGNSIFLDFLMQLAAYRQLWEENHPDQPLTGGFHLLRFDKAHADFAHHYWSELDDAWEMFKLLRRAYDLDKILKKRV